MFSCRRYHCSAFDKCCFDVWLQSWSTAIFWLQGFKRSVKILFVVVELWINFGFHYSLQAVISLDLCTVAVQTLSTTTDFLRMPTWSNLGIQCWWHLALVRQGPKEALLMMPVQVWGVHIENRGRLKKRQHWSELSRIYQIHDVPGFVATSWKMIAFGATNVVFRMTQTNYVLEHLQLKRWTFPIWTLDK